MKSIAIIIIAAVGIGAAGVANAQEALAKSSGCLTCHDMSAKKMGPSIKDIAAKFKGKANAEATVVANLAAAKGHPAVKVSGNELTSIVKWMLAQ